MRLWNPETARVPARRDGLWALFPLASRTPGVTGSRSRLSPRISPATHEFRALQGDRARAAGSSLPRNAHAWDRLWSFPPSSSSRLGACLRRPGFRVRFRQVTVQANRPDRRAAQPCALANDGARRTSPRTLDMAALSAVGLGRTDRHCSEHEGHWLQTGWMPKHEQPAPGSLRGMVDLHQDRVWWSDGLAVVVVDGSAEDLMARDLPVPRTAHAPSRRPHPPQPQALRVLERDRGAFVTGPSLTARRPRPCVFPNPSIPLSPPHRARLTTSQRSAGSGTVICSVSPCGVESRSAPATSPTAPAVFTFSCFIGTVSVAVTACLPGL